MMRIKIPTLLFISLLFLQIVLGLQWGIELLENDAIAVANPEGKLLIPFNSLQNDQYNRKRNFDVYIDNEKFICQPKRNICRHTSPKSVDRTIRQVIQYGYISNGDDGVEKNTFVAYPYNVQEQIQTFTYIPFEYNEYNINPYYLEQKHLKKETVQPIYGSTTSFTVKFKLPGKEEMTMTTEEIIEKKEEIANTEQKILQNYCKFRNNDWCEKESAVVNKLKEVYGDSIRFVKERNENLAPEFEFFKKPEQQMDLHLTNLADVAVHPYTYAEFMDLDILEKSDIEDKLKEKIASIHGCGKDEVIIEGYSEGSVNVKYKLPDSIHINYETLDDKHKEKFEEFERMEVHQIFFRPEFDIDMFDARGHKDFRDEGMSFENIGGLTYHQPKGWFRMGLNVRNKYDDGDNSWLEPFGSDNPELWARGYHGPGSTCTDSINLSSVIVKSGGLRIGSCNVYGPGVYWSDDPNYWDGDYDGKATYQGVDFDVKLMVAVRPGSYSHNTDEGNFHCPDPKDIRIYGILIR